MVSLFARANGDADPSVLLAEREACSMNDDNLIVGTAGEYIVCADLLLAGFSAFRADQAAPYDVAVDIGQRLVRIQVKSTRAPRRYQQVKQRHVVGYTWNTRAGKGARRTIRKDAIDIVALVALDIRRVAYVPIGLTRQCMQIHVSGNKGRGIRSFESSTFAAALSALEGTTASREYSGDAQEAS